MLDGHKLALQLSMRKANSDANQKGKAKQEESGEDRRGKGTKLVVRNVAFEATRKDLMALFSPFGQIKSCRLPKKMDGNHRSLSSTSSVTLNPQFPMMPNVTLKGKLTLVLRTLGTAERASQETWR